MEEKEILTETNETTLYEEESNDILDNLEDESIEKPKPAKKGRKTTKNKEIKEDFPITEESTPEDSNTLKQGDCVRITARIGAFYDGTPLSNSLRYTFLYVNQINNGIVELRDSSGVILGSLRQSYITKVK